MVSIVAALDWNFNTDRPGKLSKDGKQLYKSKVLIDIYTALEFHLELQVDRTGKKTCIVEVKVPKDYSYQHSIFKNCLTCLENDDIPEVVVSRPLQNLVHPFSQFSSLVSYRC